METQDPRRSEKHEKQTPPDTGKVKKEFPHDEPVPEIIGDPHPHGDNHPSGHSNGNPSGNHPSGGHKPGNNYNIQG